MAKLKLTLPPLGYESDLTRPTRNVRTVDRSTSITVPSLQSKCDTCKKDLTIKVKDRGSGKYLKDCTTCLAQKTASKRKRASSTPFSIVHTAGTTKKMRNTKYTPEAVRPSLSLSSSETQQPASTLGPEHAPSPDTVPMVQSATTSDLEENSDDAKVELVTERPRGRRDPIMFRKVSQQAPQDDLLKRIRDRRAEIKNNEASKESSRVVVLKLPKEKVCSVCAETLPWKHFPKLADCEHDPEVCSGCFLLWLKQQVESVTNILCPSSGCSHSITHEDVRKNAPQDVFTRFDELSMRSLLSADKNFLYCHGEGCSSGQIHDTGVEGPIFRCAACGYRMCTAHDPIIPFHENEACIQYNERIPREIAQAEEEEERDRNQQEEEARIRRQHESASAAEVAKSSVECPGCGVQIQKTKGCDHMTCGRNGCGFQFCYVCRAPYTGEHGIFHIGNSAHSPTCRYHSTRLPNFVDLDVEASDEEDSDDEDPDDEDSDDADVIDLDGDDEILRAAIRRWERTDLSYG